MGNVIETGDVVSVTLKVRRQWWKYWEPDYRYESFLFLVDRVSSETLTLDRELPKDV